MTVSVMSPAAPGGLAAADWRYLLSPPLTGAENMAIDVGLMSRAASTRECVLRVYSWSRPTLSLGRNQRVAGRYERETLKKVGLDVVRRPTGGRTILHDHEITYSVTAPVTTAWSLTADYSWINGLLLRALESMGVMAELASPSHRDKPSWTSPCFARPARGEVMVGGRKLVGSAQYRHEGAMLQHGSILLRDDQSRLRDLVETAESVVPPPATLGELLSVPPSPAELGDALLKSLRAATGRECPALDSTDAERLAARHVAQFEDERWTWGA